MIIPRNEIENALFDKINSAYLWAYSSKHWQDWANTSSQPAFYLRKGPEKVTQAKRGLNLYTLNYEIWVYAQFAGFNDPTADPLEIAVNPILEAIDTALTPDPEGYQNLGIPQIANCRLSGDIDVCDGSLDGQVVIAATVQIWVGT